MVCFPALIVIQVRRSELFFANFSHILQEFSRIIKGVFLKEILLKNFQRLEALKLPQLGSNDNIR